MQRQSASTTRAPRTRSATSVDEIGELRDAVDAAGSRAPETEPDPRVFEELGDVLFATVNLARHLNVDAEVALRAAVRRFVARVEEAERIAAADGAGLLGASASPSRIGYFDRAKEATR